jgi:hypothetical protein
MVLPSVTFFRNYDFSLLLTASVYASVQRVAERDLLLLHFDKCTYLVGKIP